LNRKGEEALVAVLALASGICLALRAEARSDSTVETGSAKQPQRLQKAAAEIRYRLDMANGSQELKVIRRTKKLVEFAFHRTRKDGCSWEVSATAKFGESSETEGEDGYPIFWDQYRASPPQTKCEILLGLEEKTAERAQINVGRKCGDSCEFDTFSLMMVEKRGPE
jgi:hypothetical protein